MATSVTPRPEIGLTLDDISTPALVLDRRVLTENIASMAARANRGNVQLWPHAKTHKSFEIAQLQQTHGAVGLTVATVREAEAFAAAGFTNLLLASPPAGTSSLDRIAELATKVRMRVVFDSGQALLALDRVCRRRGVEIPFLWEVDCGAHRFGTPPGKATATEIVKILDRAPGCRFEGLLAFAGHAYGARDDDELKTIARDEREAIAETVDALKEHGLTSETGSVGTTPTSHHFEPAVAVTEIRPGNYVFYDATQVALGVVGEERCALSVLTTVLSRPAPDRAILDSGSKALAAERMTPRTKDFGFLRGRPEVRLERLFEEHAIATVTSGHPLRIGDRARVIANHACATVNLHAEVLVVEDDHIIDVWPVEARGWKNADSLQR